MDKGDGMNNYRDSLIISINKQLEQWFDAAHPVSVEEVRNFIQTVEASASANQLHDLTEIINSLKDQLAQDDQQEWTPPELCEHLFRLIKYCYEEMIQEDVHVHKSLDPGYDKLDVLVLDDDVAHLMLLRDELEKQGLGVLTTTDPDKAINYFYELNIGCFVTSLHIMNKNGSLVIEVVRQQNNKQFIPIIGISVDDSREARLKAYEYGVDDFQTKPLDMGEFVVRMNRQLNRKNSIDKLLFLDELTGAFNRKYFKDVFEKHRIDFMRTRQPFCIAMVDIDSFKQVNDKYGHLTGDKVLIRFVNLMKERMRATDTLFRYGGEEFAMIFPNTNQADAKHVLERLLNDFMQITFESDEEQFHVSFSAGVIEATCSREKFKDWLNLADQALYAAKTSGKRKIVIADHTIKLSIHRQINIAILSDNPLIRMILSESLKHVVEDNFETDIRTYRAGELFFADSWYQGTDPYIILLDCIMPRKDGMKVLQRLRAMPNSSQYTIVILTDRSSEQDIAKAMQMGVDDYIMKPFSVEEVQIRIKRLVQRMTD
ncbi:diguanylate cyclase [Paenibacillus albiflavus]|uniref:Diguanylate cyclase n=2 Tax=Paenibacillus albiflavus TaxID=2545760 RepID=A0A4R4E777_9BACL|nr:diguanylate cyclase [Paenibacillus albiflavus]